MVKILSSLSLLEWVLGGLGVVFGTVACGAAANAVLKDLGWGTIPNGILMFMGVVLGAFVRSITIGFQ